MKSKKLWSILLMLVMMLGTVTTLSSCGSDDDGGKGTDTTNYSLVGTWKYTFEEGYTFIIVNADGTCTQEEHYNDGEVYRETAKYTYVNNTVTFVYSSGEKETFEIHWQDKNRFFTSVEGKVMTWIRQ